MTVNARDAANATRPPPKRPGSLGSSPSFVVAMVLVMAPELKYSKGSHGRNAAVVTGAKSRSEKFGFMTSGLRQAA